MKRGTLREDESGLAETVTAILLFAVFVTTLVFLNVSQVPRVGSENENSHQDSVDQAFGSLAANVESVAGANAGGRRAATSIPLGPERTVGSDAFSLFIAPPARSLGSLSYESGYGNLKVTHMKQDGSTSLDIGGDAFTPGRVAFDAGRRFVENTVLSFENGAVIAAQSGHEEMSVSPPISFTTSASQPVLSVGGRALLGSDGSTGGTNTVQVALDAIGGSLTASAGANARQALVQIATEHPDAWTEYLEEAAENGGWSSSWYTITTSALGGGSTRVTLTVTGPLADATLDVTLSYGITIFAVTIT